MRLPYTIDDVATKQMVYILGTEEASGSLVHNVQKT